MGTCTLSRNQSAITQHQQSLFLQGISFLSFLEAKLLSTPFRIYKMLLSSNHLIIKRFHARSIVFCAVAYNNSIQYTVLACQPAAIHQNENSKTPSHPSHECMLLFFPSKKYAASRAYPNPNASLCSRYLSAL